MIRQYENLYRCLQVLDEYFKRGGEGVRVTFVQVKGFNLLAGQLKQYKVSFELMSALCSMVVGQEVNLKGDQYVGGGGRRKGMIVEGRERRIGGNKLQGRNKWILIE